MLISSILDHINFKLVAIDPSRISLNFTIVVFNCYLKETVELPSDSV